MPTRAVVFDLFHTLTGPESEWSELPWTSDVLGIDYRVWDHILTTKSRWRLTGEWRNPYLILRTLAHEINSSISDKRIRESVEVRTQQFHHALQKIPLENVETLKRLRNGGLRLGLISNADVIEIAAWTDSPLAGLFGVEIFSCRVGCAKPDSVIFHKCLSALSVGPEECLFVGDGGSNELVGAKGVEFTTFFISGAIAALWPEWLPERVAIADHHITSLQEILRLCSLTQGRADELRPSHLDENF